MKLLGNENFPKTSILYLRLKGFDIKSIGIDHPGITDKEVIDIAQNEKRTIITFDRDYGELIFNKGYKPDGGVIYIRQPVFDPEEPGKLIEKVLTEEELSFNKTFTVVDNNGIRQRKY